MSGTTFTNCDRSERNRRRKFRRTILSSRSSCELCGTFHHLELHHVQAIADAPRREYDHSNIMVLCNGCHKMVHRARMIEKDLIPVDLV